MMLEEINIALCDVTYFNESTYFTTYFRGLSYIIIHIFCMMILHKNPSSSHRKVEGTSRKVS
jgi:hypothetical protein